MKKNFLTALILSTSIVFTYATSIESSLGDQPGDSSGSDVCYTLSSNMYKTVGSGYYNTDAQTNGEVTKLQQFLQDNGYLIPNPTGYFGAQTFAAVKKFQTNSNIGPSGYVGAITRAKIKDFSCTTSSAGADGVNTTTTNTSTNTTSQTAIDTTVINATLTVSNDSNGTFITNGSAWNGDPLYMRISGVKKSFSPLGCAQPAGATTCQSANGYRSYNLPTDSWINDTTIQTVIQNTAGYPTGIYEAWVKYPNGQPVKVGTFELKKSTKVDGLMTQYLWVCIRQAGSQLSTISLIGHVCDRATVGTEETLGVTSCTCQVGTLEGYGNSMKFTNDAGQTSPAATLGWTTQDQANARVNATFSLILGRAGDTAGVNYYAGKYLYGTPLSGIAWDLAISQEEKNRGIDLLAMTNDAFVDKVFTIILGRVAGAGNAYVDALANGTKTRKTVFVEIFNSKESRMRNSAMFAYDVSSTQSQVLGDSTVCVDLNQNFHRGDESSQTTSLQKFLLSKGFLSNTATGFYGDKTVDAVKAYQKSKGLPETGMVYDFTRQAIRTETCK